MVLGLHTVFFRLLPFFFPYLYEWAFFYPFTQMWQLPNLIHLLNIPQPIEGGGEGGGEDASTAVVDVL